MVPGFLCLRRRSVRREGRETSLDYPLDHPVYDPLCRPVWAQRAQEVTELEMGDLVAGEDGTLSVTRAQFEKLCQPLFNRTLDTVKAVLKDAKLPPGDIDDIVLVGGSTRVPCIQNMLLDFFGGQKTLCKSINPDEVAGCVPGICLGTTALHAMLLYALLPQCCIVWVILVARRKLGSQCEFLGSGDGGGPELSLLAAS